MAVLAFYALTLRHMYIEFKLYFGLGRAVLNASFGEGSITLLSHVPLMSHANAIAPAPILLIAIANHTPKDPIFII